MSKLERGCADRQNEIADLIGIEVHSCCSTFNSWNGSYEILIFRNKGKDDKKRKADETDSKEKNTNRRGEKIQRSWLDELPGLVYELDTSTSHAETNVIYCQICSL